MYFLNLGVEGSNATWVCVLNYQQSYQKKNYCSQRSRDKGHPRPSNELLKGLVDADLRKNEDRTLQCSY